MMAMEAPEKKHPRPLMITFSNILKTNPKRLKRCTPIKRSTEL
jgi:hypothetical protein